MTDKHDKAARNMCLHCAMITDYDAPNDVKGFKHVINSPGILGILILRPKIEKNNIKLKISGVI